MRRYSTVSWSVFPAMLSFESTMDMVVLLLFMVGRRNRAGESDFQAYIGARLRQSEWPRVRWVDWALFGPPLSTLVVRSLTIILDTKVPFLAVDRKEGQTSKKKQFFERCSQVKSTMKETIRSVVMRMIAPRFCVWNQCVVSGLFTKLKEK